jgi:hypothetical protein
MVHLPFLCLQFIFVKYSNCKCKRVECGHISGNTSTGISIKSYHAKIGTFVARNKEKYMMAKSEEDCAGSQIWFLRLVIMVLSGLPVKQGKTDQILVHVKNQKESKMIKGLLETHNKKSPKLRMKPMSYAPNLRNWVR